MSPSTITFGSIDRSYNSEYIVNRLTDIESLFSSLSISLQPTSRIGTYIRLFRDGANKSIDARRYTNTSEEAERLVAHAYNDIGELICLVDSYRAGVFSDPKALESKLKLVVKDTINASASNRDAIGRNTQWELYLHAVLGQGGLNCDVSEPDIKTVIDTVDIGIACKRIVSQNMFEQRIKHANQQIVRSKTPGIIAIDCTYGLNKDDEVFVCRDKAHAEETLEKATDAYHEKYDGWISSTLDKQYVKLVIIRAKLSVVMDNNQRMTCTAWLDSPTSPIGSPWRLIAPAFRFYLYEGFRAMDRQSSD